MPMTRASVAGSRPTSWRQRSTRPLSCLHGGQIVLSIGVPGASVSRGEAKHSIATAPDQDGRAPGGVPGGVARSRGPSSRRL